MVDKHADGVVIAVNGQVPDGEDLSWLWDVRFEHFEATPPWSPPANAAPTWRCVWATRASSTPWCTTPWRRSHRARPAASRCVANYTAFLQLNGVGAPWLTRRCGSGWCCPT